MYWSSFWLYSIVVILYICKEYSRWNSNKEEGVTPALPFNLLGCELETTFSFMVWRESSDSEETAPEISLLRWCFEIRCNQVLNGVNIWKYLKTFNYILILGIGMIKSMTLACSKIIFITFLNPFVLSAFQRKW